MSFFQRLASFFAPSSGPPARKQEVVTVKCNRCGEIITAPIDLRNDMSEEYGENGGKMTYICRKTVMGRQRCFQQIEITLYYNDKRKLTSKEIVGGKFVEPAATPAPQ